VTTVLSSVQPEHAGSASGILSTVQQVGNALGVAVTGVLFFTMLGSGYSPAFAASEAEFAVLLFAVAALTRLLPRHMGVRS
jgi:predicted MFS family arabinose efflux permease